LLGRLTRITVETVLRFHAARAAQEGGLGAKSGAVAPPGRPAPDHEDVAEECGEGDPEGNLAASAVFGQAPPAGPHWVSRLAPLEPQARAYDKPRYASLDGFTLHAATRAGALDSAGREALLCYVLRPPVAQERVEQRPDGLVRITLKKAARAGQRS